MNWWQMLLDSPAQIAIITGIGAAVVVIPASMGGWYLRGWWIDKRPDGPLLITIKKLEENNTQLIKIARDADERCDAFVGYAHTVVRHFTDLAELSVDT